MIILVLWSATPCSGTSPRRFNRPPFLLRIAKSSVQLPTTRTKYYAPMDSNLQQNPSARALASIEIIDETPNLAGQLGSFPPNAQPFTSFRNIDNVAARPHLHNSTRPQDTITLENNVHDSSSDGISLLPSADPSFPQSGYEGLAQDPTAASFAGQLQGMRMVPDPPNLEYWRNRLFHVDEMITLSEDEYVGHSSYLTSSTSFLDGKETTTDKPSELTGLIGSRPTSHTSTMSTLIVQHNDTNAGHSYLIIGTVDSKVALQEHQSPTIPTKRNVNAPPEKEISVMSR